MNEKRYTLDGEAIDLAEFAAVNDLGLAELSAIDAMAIGDEITLGGGAGAEFTLRRER